MSPPKKRTPGGGPADRSAQSNRGDCTRTVAPPADDAQYIEWLWAQCVPLTPGDPVVRYLDSRGLGGLWPLPACLRYHSALPYCDDDDAVIGTHPAMVAPLTLAGRTVALACTYLTRDGRLADVPAPWQGTPPSAGTGACVALYAPDARGMLGVTESIEDALACRVELRVPTVAICGAGSLAAWQWPPGVRHLIVFARNTPTGLEAAETLRARAVRAGLDCAVLVPVSGGDVGDVRAWLDQLAGRGA